MEFRKFMKRCKKTTFNKVMAFTMALMLTAASVTGCAGAGSDLVHAGETSAGEQVQNTENNTEEMLTSVMENQVVQRTDIRDDAGKDETVYVVSDAAGAAQQVIVSEWLKNTTGADTIDDITNLTDIENVKGNETWMEGADGKITWQADGNDIYYQGKSDRELPVQVKLTYYLDGKEIAPEELAGKSGKVTIRFDYTNTAKKTVTVNGKKEEITVPFAVVSGAILSSEYFKNVSVTNGKVISDGENDIVVGIALPGLSDSLKLDELKKDAEDKSGDDDLNIPEYIEITADAQDFELDMTLTMALNDVLSDLNLTDSLDMSEAADSADELTDASSQLVDGSGQLKEGVETLNSSTGEFSDGIHTLADGISAYTDGAGQLADGISTLKAGTTQLRGGAGTLFAGMTDLGSGASALTEGTGQLKEGVSALAEGAGQLVNGASALTAGTGKLKDGASALAAGTGQLKDGVSSLTAGTSQLKDGASALTAATGQLKDGAAALKGGISELKEKAPSLLSGVQSLKEGSASALSGIGNLLQGYEGENGVVQGSQNLTGGLNQLKTSVDGMGDAELSDEQLNEIGNAASGRITSDTAEQILESCGITSDNESYGALVGTITSQLQSAASSGAQAGARAAVNGVNEKLSSRMESLKGSVSELAAGASGLSQGINQLYDGTSQLKDGIQSLDDGLAQLNDQTGALADGITTIDDGAGSLQEGIDQVDGGAASVAAGAGQVDDGAGSLAAGIDQADTGAAGLVSGIGQVDSGAAELKTGIDQAAGGAGALVSGAGQIDDGAIALKDGIGQAGRGAEALAEGADILDDGASQLKSGSDKLAGNSAALNNGAGKLLEGKIIGDIPIYVSFDSADAWANKELFQFDEEGIQKIADLLGDDLNALTDRLEAIVDAGKEYQTFTGLADGVKGSVKFIIRTGAIK